ncbi:MULTISPECIES: 5-formyltetrahydrofolate cyclo-ligase [unclassified Acinetobacter]|uniref:5-formyltetrahydrofolate cyclo-ligase n=1 Tax=unclassified Acinetobacter TaxID=196816 RepID=UPI0035BA4122
MTSSMTADRFQDIKKQRRLIAKQRRQLSIFQLRQAEQKVLQRLKNDAKINHAQHIGIYLDAFGEIPTRQFITYLLSQKKSVYLPKICSMNQRLLWQKISINQLRQQRFYKHRLGMFESALGRATNTQKLDIIIMPLVLFDHFGQRVGMGGGYYDRTLSRYPYLPYRLALAHDFQCVAEKLIQQKWDENINAVCTPTHFYRFKPHFSKTRSHL